MLPIVKTSFVIGESNFHSLSWFLGDFFGVSARIGVCLFLMLAGALSLGRKWKIKKFLGKRIPRIVFPFLLWGFVSATVLVIMYFSPIPQLAIQLYGNNIPQSPLNLMNYLDFVGLYYMAEATTSTPYWFFWMILGTYLIMPIFNKWIYHSKMDEIEYYLVFWLITCVFDFTLGYEFPIKLSYFVSPMGLVVLGYYLRHTNRKILNNPYFALLLVLSSIIVEMSISYFLSTPAEIYHFDRYSIFIAIEVTGVFLLFKNFNKLNIRLEFLNNPKSLYRRIVFSIARCSYGMYLTHAVILAIIWHKFFKNIGFFMSHNTLTMIVLLIMTVFISWQTINILSRIPQLSKIVGAK